MSRGVRRPADERRRELAEVAAAQFHRLGFHRVALAGVAAEVGVTAPAVYRHFRNKNALLAGAIATGLDRVEAALDRSTSLDDALDRLAEAALQRRDVWVLLQREIRHLADNDRAHAEHRFRDLVRRFATHVQAARPELEAGQVQMVVTAAFGVLASPSTRPVTLPHKAYRAALVSAARAACSADLPAAEGAAPVPTARTGTEAGRSEQVLETAIRLFHQRGYAAVSMDDIGGAVGIAGPSIYHHFTTKADLLIAAHARATSQLPRPRADAEQPLRDLVERYVAVVVRERELFGVHVTEELDLPHQAAGPINSAVRDDIDRWIATLRTERPELSRSLAEVVVHAARGTVHDIARVGRLHTRPAVTAETVAIACAVLA